VPFLLRGISNENGLCFDFIREAIKRFDEDEAFPALFNDAMVAISAKLAQISMEQDYKPYVQVRFA
jgi:ubiquitin conjugation factor E4 B